MVPAFTIMAVVATTREWRWLSGLRWAPGLLWMLVLVSPWFIAIMIQTKGAFLQQSLGDDMLSKVAGAREAHGAPPGTYLVAAQFFFWPFAPLAILTGPWAWRNRKQASVLFLLAWLVPFWLVFEAVPTKLPHYVLPAYPALAILVSTAIVNKGLVRSLWARIVALLVPLLALALPIAILGAGWMFDHVVVWRLLPIGVVAVVLASLAWSRFGRGEHEAGVVLSALASLSLFWAIGWAAIPAVSSIWPAPRLMEVARRAACPNPHFASLGYREPSLVFLAGTDLKMLSDATEAAAFLVDAGAECRIAFVDEHFEPAFTAALGASAAKTTLLGHAHGVNLNGNKPVDMAVYQAAAR
jgi:4-amino-4-deoxy-L-arabinose transferase-like glycosyltransferase